MTNNYLAPHKYIVLRVEAADLERVKAELTNYDVMAVLNSDRQIDFPAGYVLKEGIMYG